MTGSSGDSQDSVNDPMTLAKAITKAGEHAETRVRNLPYLNTPKPIPVSKILLAFVHGILYADPWTLKYALPPGFESVVNFIAFNLIRMYGKKQMAEISINAAVDLVWGYATDNPRFEKWGEWNGPDVVGTSAAAPIPEGRTFIDLQAAKMNMRLFLSAYHQGFETDGKKLGLDPE